MGHHIIKMPDIGEGIAEVELVAWRVQPGETVAEDQILADVMTDKATVEIPSPVVGTVVSLGGQVGEQMAVGAELIRLEVEGAGNVKPGAAAKPGGSAAAGSSASAAASASTAKSSAADLPSKVATASALAASSPPVASDGGTSVSPVLSPSTLSKGVPAEQSGLAGSHGAASAHASAASATAANSRAGTVTRAPTSAPAPTRAPGDKPIASPAVRRRAWDLGVELQFVHGSGPAGRIMNDDLDVYLASRGQPAPATGRGGTPYAERNSEDAIPVIGLRRKIAQKMQEAKRRIPHFSYVEEIDVTELEALRGRLNAKFANERGKLTVLPLLVRAVVLAVRDFPQMNARYDDDGGVVTRYGAVHLGIATQTGSGLMVPVLRHAETHDLWRCAAEIARLAEAARSGKAARDELSGSTITITSLGALGGIVTTPVINHPEVAIVGVNRMVERPMIRQGAVVARQMMNLSSSFDHRVVDGLNAAEFIQAIRALLETPAMLFVE